MNPSKIILVCLIVIGIIYVVVIVSSFYDSLQPVKEPEPINYAQWLKDQELKQSHK